MKNKSILFSLLMLSGVMLAACSDYKEEQSIYDDIVQRGSQVYYVYDLDLNCSIPDYDGNGTTRSTSYSWEDGATVYIWFSDGDYVSGKATYNSSTGKWRITTSSSISVKNDSRSCLLFYVANPGDITSSAVNLTPFSETYCDYSGTYMHSSSSSISVSATLFPFDSRMRFKGTSGTKIQLSMNGYNYNTKIGMTAWNLWNYSDKTQTFKTDLEVTNGYTPYLHGNFYDKDNEIKIELINNSYPNYKFTRTVVGKGSSYNSYCLTIPTPTNYSGWERTEIQAQDELIYREPYINWGASKNQTKNYMSSYTLYQEEDNSLIYTGLYKETLTAYTFESSKLVSSTIVVANNVTSQTEIDKQLKKNNYSYVGSQSDVELYISADNKTVVMLSNNSQVSAYYIRYCDYEWLMKNDTETLYEEPYIKWGTARSTVKNTVANMGYSLLSESEQASDYYYLAYSGKMKEDFCYYYFDSSKKLDQVNVVFYSNGYSVDDLRDYLSSGLSYTFKGTNSAKTQFFYLTPDGKSYAVVTSGTFTDGTAYTEVIYISYDAVSSNAPRRVRQGNMTFETIETRKITKPANSEVDVFHPKPISKSIRSIIPLIH